MSLRRVSKDSPSTEPVSPLAIFAEAASSRSLRVRSSSVCRQQLASVKPHAHWRSPTEIGPLNSHHCLHDRLQGRDLPRTEDTAANSRNVRWRARLTKPSPGSTSAAFLGGAPLPDDEADSDAFSGIASQRSTRCWDSAKCVQSRGSRLPRSDSIFRMS
jgi:hypothetical protein